MTDETAAPRMFMPGGLKGALVILWLQFLANAFVGYIILDELSEDASHGRSMDGTGFSYFLGYLSIAVAIVLAVCAVLALRGRSWVRPTIISIESLSILSGVVNLFSGAFLGIVGIALSIGVIVVLNRPDVREWFER
jgi:hypothetical protein